MRSLSLVLTILLYVPSAFAVKDLLAHCERKLTVAKDVEVTLAPNQVSFKGPLMTYWEPSMEKRVAYIMGDEFIHKNISPSGQDFVQWLSPGDRVFVLESDGTVVAQGYYGEIEDFGLHDFAGVHMQTVTNMPHLYSDPGLKEIAVTGPEMRKYFSKQVRAVVIKTLKDSELKSLKDRLGPALSRYESNRKNGDRFVRVGRRRGFELAHFQTPMTGRANVTIEQHQTAILEFSFSEFAPPPPMFTFNYELMDGPSKIELQQNDYLMLLDENGVVTAEGVVGGPQFPWVTDREPQAVGIQAKFRTAYSAFVAKVVDRKLD